MSSGPVTLRFFQCHFIQNSVEVCTACSISWITLACVHVKVGGILMLATISNTIDHGGASLAVANCTFSENNLMYTDALFKDRKAVRSFSNCGGDACFNLFSPTPAESGKLHIRRGRNLAKSLQLCIHPQWSSCTAMQSWQYTLFRAFAASHCIAAYGCIYLSRLALCTPNAFVQ